MSDAKNDAITDLQILGVLGNGSPILKKPDSEKEPQSENQQGDRDE